MGVMAGIAAAGLATTVGSTIANGMSGGPDPNGSYGGQPGTYIPTNQPGADQNYQNLTNMMYGPATSVPGQISDLYNRYVGSLLGNLYAQPAVSSALNTASVGTNTVAPMQLGGAQGLYNLAQSATPYATQILQTGFDPQGALYNRTQHQVQDQLNAVNAMNGLSGSPYGAGVVGQGLSNFNIDWQNQQLARQAAAAQGYGSLINSIGQGYSGASGLAGGALSTLQNSGLLPYTTYRDIVNDDLAGIGTLSGGLSGAYALPQQLLGDYQSYLGLGQAASGQAMNGQQQGFNQGQTIGSNIGQALSNPTLQAGLANLFGPSTPTYTPYTPSNTYGGMDLANAYDLYV